MLSGDHAASAAAAAIFERRLIRDAKRGDRTAEARLLELYEPMVRHIAFVHSMPRGERDDLAQHARLGIVGAIHAWDPRRRVPFRAFAWLCAVRETRSAVNAARAYKHRRLNGAYPLDGRLAGDHRLALEETLEATDRPDADPVARALGRERLREILARARTLTELERRALALSASECSHRDCAAMLGVGEKAVNNALQRARRKLLAPTAA